MFFKYFCSRDCVELSFLISERQAWYLQGREGTKQRLPQLMPGTLEGQNLHLQQKDYTTRAIQAPMQFSLCPGTDTSLKNGKGLKAQSCLIQEGHLTSIPLEAQSPQLQKQLVRPNWPSLGEW